MVINHDIISLGNQDIGEAKEKLHFNLLIIRFLG